LHGVTAVPLLVEPSSAFSLVSGGPVHDLFVALRLERGDGRDFVRQSFAFVGVAWIPLVALAVLEHLGGPATGVSKDPFLSEVSAHARLLVAVPLLFLSEQFLDTLTKRCIGTFLDGQFTANREAATARAIARAERWRDSRGAELILAVLIVAFSEGAFWTGSSMWLEPAPWRTLAGAWYGLVAIPATQFLFGRWLLRWAIWSQLLYHLSRLSPRVTALHPDCRGGVAFLSEPAIGFAVGLAAYSTTQAGAWFDQIRARGGSLRDFAGSLAATLLFAAIVVLVPLAPWTLPLERARLDGEREYDHLAVEYVRRFREKWISSGRHHVPPLGSRDIQSLSDLGNSFKVVRDMRVLPIDRRIVVIVLGAVLLPLAPVALAESSPGHIVVRALSMVLGEPR
jgi:hypothetical protein